MASPDRIPDCLASKVEGVVNAPEADVLRVLDMADRHSPHLDVHLRARDVCRVPAILPG